MSKDDPGVHWNITGRAVAPHGSALTLMGHPLVYSWLSLG
jgi:hypothetical protein